MGLTGLRRLMGLIWATLFLHPVHFPNLFILFIAVPIITEGRKKFVSGKQKKTIFEFFSTNEC
jgi:hypothetical protein